MTFRILNVAGSISESQNIYNTLKVCRDTDYGRHEALGNIMHTYISGQAINYCTKARFDPEEKRNGVIYRTTREASLRLALFLVKNPDILVIRVGSFSVETGQNTITRADWLERQRILFSDTTNSARSAMGLGPDKWGYQNLSVYLAVQREIMKSLPQYQKVQRENYRKAMENLG